MDHVLREAGTGGLIQCVVALRAVAILWLCHKVTKEVRTQSGKSPPFEVQLGIPLAVLINSLKQKTVCSGMLHFSFSFRVHFIESGAFCYWTRQPISVPCLFLCVSDERE